MFHRYSRRAEKRRLEFLVRRTLVRALILLLVFLLGRPRRGHPALDRGQLPHELRAMAGRG